MTAPTQPTTLAAWLEQCVAADEAAALAGHPAHIGWTLNGDVVNRSGEDDIAPAFRRSPIASGEYATHIARHDPARTLREVAFHREVLRLHEAGWISPENWWACGACGTAGEYDVMWPCPTLRALASVYAGNEGWREEWA